MEITDPFVMPPGVELIPVVELDDDIRIELGAAAGDYAVARPGARIAAKLIDPATAMLLRCFTTPTTIVDAVIDVSKVLGEDPESLLTRAHPILLRFIRVGLLMTPDQAAKSALEPRHRAGEAVAGCVIRSCIHVLDDTELYVVSRENGRQAILKIARGNAAQPINDFAREARALERIAGTVAPHLYVAGAHGDRAFNLMELRQGIVVSRVADEHRRSGAAGARQALASLASSVAGAYASLHANGVVHGDVHEGNVLVDRAGKITLVDFGLARISGESPPARLIRGGHGFYIDPEFARAILAGDSHPEPSELSDQYSLAAMLYSLFTGVKYLDFRPEEAEALRQIVVDRMLPFSHRGAAPWPEFERVLEKALSKNPAARYACVAEFAAELQRAFMHPVASGSVVPVNPAAAARRRAASDAVLKRLRTAVLVGDTAAMPAPTATVAFGAAGVAAGLYRLAQLHHDAALLSHADRWSIHALAECRRSRGLYDGNDLTSDNVGRRSLYYGTSGPHVGRALIANAMGDFVTMNDAVRSLETLPKSAGEPLDLFLGVPGTLIGLSLVLEALPDGGLVSAAPVLRAGGRCARAIADALAARSSVRDEYTFVNLGMAHGWSGALYSLMRWNQACGTPVDASIGHHLDDLVALAEPVDRGLRWPWRDVRSDDATTHGYMAGWCNGSAGFVHLFLTAHEMYGDSRYRETAEGAGWDAWEEEDAAGFDLCCGRAGRGYAMLALYRSTGDAAWLQRAHQLAIDGMDELADLDCPSLSLYKGALGPVLLYAELEVPHLARMPLFESENWPRRQSVERPRGR